MKSDDLVRLRHIVDALNKGIANKAGIQSLSRIWSGGPLVGLFATVALGSHRFHGDDE
jgi:biopolymer transport protein ExbB/TolQ